jgi:chemotaxis response regulator CheB
MGEIRAAGGFTVAQSQETCVVFGMPKAAIERGYAMRIADLQDLPKVSFASTMRARPCRPGPWNMIEVKRATGAGSN